MNNDDLENDLATLLADLSSIQEELLQVLAKKRDLMAAGNVQSMTDLQQREESLCQQLQECHDRREALLKSAAEHGLQTDSIGQLSNQLSSESRTKLQRQTKETTARMRLLQHNSLTNWVLAQRSLLHIAQLLEIIATGGQIQPTYGEGQSVHSRGKLVDQEI